MVALFNLKSVTNQGDLRALRTFYDAVETRVRQLKALGVSKQAYNLLLPPVVMKGLPAELR